MTSPLYALCNRPLYLHTYIDFVKIPYTYSIDVVKFYETPAFKTQLKRKAFSRNPHPQNWRVLKVPTVRVPKFPSPARPTLLIGNKIPIPYFSTRPLPFPLPSPQKPFCQNANYVVIRYSKYVPSAMLPSFPFPIS